MSGQNRSIDVVDESDNVIGTATMDEVWKKGLYHRIVRIMVEDDRGRVLLQKRSPHMDLYPNCWDHSAAGHVDVGESYEQAAVRELFEELAIKGVGLTEIAHYKTSGEFKGRKLNRWNKLYKAFVSADQRLTVQEYEVSEVRWFAKDELGQFIAHHADQVTEGLKQVVREYY